MSRNVYIVQVYFNKNYAIRRGGLVEIHLVHQRQQNTLYPNKGGLF